MATPIGTDVVTSIVRRYILPDVVDNIYNSNVVFFRLNAANKKIVRGGTQIEVPLMYQRFAAGGSYSGFELLNVTPSDTVKNGAWDWKQYHVPVSVDGLTLIKTDSPEAVADFVRLYTAQAEMEMAELLGAGIFSDGSVAKDIDGLEGAVDDSAVLATYGGLARGSNSWWNAQVDKTTTPLTLSLMQTMFGNCTKGGRHPTIIVTTQTNYNRLWVLNQGDVQINVGIGGTDEILANAGFTNQLFNGVPVVVDSHVPTDGPAGGGSGHHMYFLNEDYIWLAVSPRADFYVQDFQTPINQNAYTSQMFWAGNLVLNNCNVQGKLCALTS